MEEIHASAKESAPVTVREKYPISRAEARDHFNEIADHAGVYSAWNKLFIATSGKAKTLERVLPPAPSPGLRRFWIEASTAGKVRDQLRTLEEEWASLFESSSDLPIFHQENLVRPLIEFLGINKTLAGVVARTVIEGRLDVEHLPKAEAPSPPPLHLPARTPGVSRANSAAPLPSIPVEEDAPATLKNKAAGRRPTLTGPRLQLASRKEPVPALAHENISITRAQARAHFDEIAARAGLRSVWDNLVITPSATRQTLDMPGLAPEAVLNPPANSERAIDEACVNYQDPSAVVFSPRADRLVGGLGSARIRSGATLSNALRMVDLGSANVDMKLSEDRLDQLVGPLVETIQSSQRLARTKLASREARVGSHRRSETDDANLMSEVPLTGLRRLAAMAVNAADEQANKSGRTMFDDRRTPPSEPGPLVAPHAARGEEVELASQLAEFLRSEVLRHGIGLENS